MAKYYGEGKPVTRLLDAIPFIRDVAKDLVNEPQGQHGTDWARNAQIVDSKSRRLWLITLVADTDSTTKSLEEFLQYVSTNIGQGEIYAGHITDSIPGSTYNYKIAMAWQPYREPESNKPIVAVDNRSFFEKMGDTLFNTSGW